MYNLLKITRLTLAFALVFSGCVGQAPEGVERSQAASTTVKMDFFHRPLPEIPLPNDVATRFDASSATGLRINASMVASTRFERRMRQLVDELDGWGLFQPITVPFTDDLDVASILAGHQDPDYDPSNDVMLLINIDPASPEVGRLHHLDLGNGNFPVILEQPDRYGPNDPREWLLNLLYEEADEDSEGNGDGDGVLDPGEDSDGDGVLDRPNYLPGQRPGRDDLAGRADALMTFYEAQTRTLIARPLMPLLERTRYAVVITRRLQDAKGRPVGSPYPFIHHASQTAALQPLADLLPRGTELDDVAFAFSFTTGTAASAMMAVRDGLYGHGPQAHLADQFPARLDALTTLRAKDQIPATSQPHLIHPEEYGAVVAMFTSSLLGQQSSVNFSERITRSHKYVDYQVMGSFRSPQLFRRFDDQGEQRDLHDQVWPPDLDRVPAPAVEQEVQFWLTVPREEVSARGQGKPAPLVILGHGYMSSRMEILFWGSFFAQHGLATVAIDLPSHGMGITPAEAALASSSAKALGLDTLLEAMFVDRARDDNGDARKDPGADFLTAYAFHTRDMIRQSVLDLMQLARILRTFDGQQRWDFDLDGDGQPDLAGDFDGDGTVDVSGAERLSYLGNSLGAIVGTVLAGCEPAVDTLVANSTGGSLLDVGLRSRQAGVVEGFLLRLMGPLYTGTLSADGELLLETVVPDLTSISTHSLGKIEGVAPGDTLVAENLQNGERGCGLVDSEGRVRLGLQSDRGDPTRLLVYTGAVIVGPDCELQPGASPRVTVDTFQETVTFQQQTFDADTPLEALATGMGQQRATPELRRTMFIGSVANDAADPAVFATHLQRRPLTYASTGETTSTSSLFTVSIGDVDVPTSAGISVARAAGLVDFLHTDPRYGRPANQVLLDTYTMEGVHWTDRYTAGDVGIHMDVDNLSGGGDIWGSQVPRMEHPLRLIRRDSRGGRSAVLFPYTLPHGYHSFYLPGQMTDRLVASCQKQCTASGGSDPCGCLEVSPFDVGQFMFNVLGRYLRTGGKTLSLNLCNSRDDCPDLPSPPAPRNRSTLP